MKNFILNYRTTLLFLLIIPNFIFAQTVFWTENFGAGCNQGTNANTYSGTNGAWTVTNTGTNAAEANKWFVSATEAGMGAGICGDGCLGTASLTNRSLHIGSDDNFFPTDMGASYNAGGLCGFFFCVATDRRAESPAINCTGQSTITLSFNYMEGGQGSTDNSTLWYFDGSVWSQLVDLPKTTVCGSGQGLWTAYSIALPSSADNNPNIKIGFRWVNNDDGTGTDPSFAVDDITLSIPATTNTLATGTISGSPFCAGDAVSVPYTSTGTFNAGNVFTAQLSDATGSFAAAVNIGTLTSTANTGTISATIPPATASGTAYRIRVVSSNPSVTGTDNGVNFTINAAAPVSVNISASPSNIICQGEQIDFTATPTNGGTPTYQWLVNGNPAGTNSAAFSSSTLSNGDVMSCVMASSLGCVSGNPATSNAITITVNPDVTVSASISANPAGPVCAGDNITFTANVANGGTPSYQWQVNGANAGTNSSTFSSLSLNDGDEVFCIVTSSLSCTVDNPVNSDTITVEIAPPLPVDVNITASPSASVCTGETITFTATVTNGGAPSYQWQVNGLNAGTNSPNFSSALLLNGDVVTCIVTSSLGCVTNNPVTSNVITVEILLAAPVSVSISESPSNTICQGETVIFTASPSNGGASPAYQWQVNGVNAGTNSTTFSSATLNDGDVVTCILTSSSSCAILNPATSNSITITVIPLAPVSLNITASPSSTVCQGETITFTANPANEGSSPDYQWQVNGVNAGINSPTFSGGILNDGDVVSCILTSSLNCATGNPATSNSITITVTPSAPLSVNITANPAGIICEGDPVTFTATTTNGGSATYQWQVNGTNAGTNSNTFSSSSLANNSVITVVVTSSLACATNSPATSNSITAVISPCTSYIPSFTPSSTSLCERSCINFTDNSIGNPGSWNWSFPGGTPSASNLKNPEVCYNTPGIYNVVLEVADVNGGNTAIITYTNLITVKAYPSIEAGSDITIETGESAEITAVGGNGIYFWGPSGSLSCENCINPVASPDETTMYYVSLTENGCTSKDSITVFVEEAIGDLFLPLAFSPNNDGANDVLYARGKNIMSMTLTVYDRWGAKIFETNDQNIGWDGTANGSPANTGTYAYCLYVKLKNDEEVKKSGKILLTR